MDFDLIQKFKDGGPMMWPLLIALFVAMVVMLERIFNMFLQRRKLKPSEFYSAMEEEFKKTDKDTAVDNLIKLCDKKGGASANVFREGLIKYRETTQYNLNVMETKQWVNMAVEERGRIEIPVLEARIGIIATVAGVSPLMGLLGTVTGMIVSFNVMASSKGGAKPDELAGGISQALITTATGMIIAIPCLLVYNWLKSRVEAYILEMEEVAIQMVDKLVQKQ